jgi:hypothetical protein
MRLVDKLSVYMAEEKACYVLIFMVSPHTCLEGYMSAALSCQMVNRRFQLVGLNSLRERAGPTRASSNRNGLDEFVGPVISVQASCVCELSAGARVDAGASCNKSNLLTTNSVATLPLWCSSNPIPCFSAFLESFSWSRSAILTL